MADKYKNSLQKILADIIAQLPRKATAQQKLFVEQFYAKMPMMELEKLDCKTAAAIALDAYNFVVKRDLGQPNIRFFQPKLEVNGWDGAHMALEIINDDMPFLVDSVTSALQQHAVPPVRLIHPIIKVKRSKNGELREVIAAADEQDVQLESLIHIDLPLLPKGITTEFLESELRNVLEAVRLAVNDWKLILQKCQDVEQTLKNSELPVRAEEVQETIDFLRWLRDKNFIFLGYIEYDFYDDDGKDNLRIVENSELGLFKLDDLELKPQGLTSLPPEVRHFAMLPHLIEITKSNRKSIVHRHVHMDYIGIKRFDGKGNAIGEMRFLGLFTSSVYYQSAMEIPVIRRKVNRLLERANFDPTTHDGKALKAIVEFSPRDELFQMSEEDLFNYAIGVLSVEAHPDVHLFIRRDIFERFISCMVFVPRDLFSTALREEIQKILEDKLGGRVTAYYTQMTDSPLARAHIIVKTKPGKIPNFKLEDIQAEVAKVAYRWPDMLRRALHERHGEAEGEKLYISFENAFGHDYINEYDIKNAIYDIEKIREVSQTGQLGLELFRGPDTIHLKFYNPDAHAALSDILPILENLGFLVIDENPFRIMPSGDGTREVWIRDFRLAIEDDKGFDIKALKNTLEDVLLRVWYGEIDDDGFNKLALRAGLDWRKITLLRAYSCYAKQARVAYSQSMMIQTLCNNPEIARELINLFELRFNPDRKRPRSATRNGDDEQEKLLAHIEALLENVPSLEEDRILRRFRDLILATWRTNYYQTTIEGGFKPYISLKFNSEAIPDLPLPKPFAEIFVYSRRIEGIHLRGGKVARGGLRWSDRTEDYRTEILGLMKAQMVKNAVIVPVGSKGGFVVKQPPKDGGREELLNEAIECYKTYLRGLLDITDNIVQGTVIPPDRVVRHDDDDPYLVVAADKGTASFSDYANEVAAEYGFWLDDAFASGGSVGYDHKAMGITARGAWVAVQRHFREMGVDVQKEDFTCVGIGDMGGDVFGNGMLLSKHIKLVGAFNHLHIFLDPDPDPLVSYKERKRLFNLPRSSWLDYNPKLISKGGGVFSRTDKQIPISPQMRKLLGVKDKKLPPDAVIRALLKADVDLLWNGGIGTYVKAEIETHEQVGDRANNALRVNGKELRCKVVGEGGNLGFTQLGRIEYAMRGGRINTDAIDNSAGVDCSDHEVNIKIAFRKQLESGELKMARRNKILEQMTDEVADLVLRDNLLQTQAISVAEVNGPKMLASQARMMQAFERIDFLNRKVEYLPDDKQIAERKQAGYGLTRPEIAVLLSYAKMAIYRDLLDSNLPDESYLVNDLRRYFPQLMQRKFGDAIEKHPLRREIIATSVTNSIVNRAGITFFFQLQEDSGMPGCDIARAYVIARDAFNIHALWTDLEANSSKIPAKTQAAMYAETSRFLESVVSWLLRTLPQPLDIESTLSRYVDGIEEYLQKCDSMVSRTLQRAYENKKRRFLNMGATKDLAHRIARLEIASCAFDVVKTSHDSGLSIAIVGKTYFELGAALRLGWLRREASRMPLEGHWERLAAKAVISELYDQQRRLTASVLPKLCDKNDCSLAVERWKEAHAKTVARYTDFIRDLKAHEAITFPMLVIALRNVESISAM